MDELDMQLHETLAERQRALRRMTKAQRHRYFEKMFLTDFKVESDGTIYREFIDDGWSGVNFAHPAFMEFMELAERGKVGTLIVKDHSRLGWNRLVVGQLLECGTSFAARDCPASRWRQIRRQRNRIYGLGPTLIAKRLCAEKVLTPELVQFIEKIVVSEARYLDNKRVQVVDIYYRGVGMIRGFSPEELEAIFQEGESCEESESPTRQERRAG